MKEMIKKMREEKDGFTIAELLIVVAIVAVMVAIAIPVFTAQLNEAKYGTDEANARSLYGELKTSEAGNLATVSAPSVSANGKEQYVTVTINGTQTNTYKFSGIVGITITAPTKAADGTLTPATVVIAKYGDHPAVTFPMTAPPAQN